MFTGIVEEAGTVRGVVSTGTRGEISLRARTVLEGTKIGDSISVNGVCLTVTRLDGDGFAADVMPETLRRSNLGALRAGDAVNLERAMAADGRFGGHIVSGHIDGTGVIRRYRTEQNAVWVSIDAPREILELVVEKGSVAIDGVSLTVAAVDAAGFQVSVIPHTGAQTTLLAKGVGAVVNLENDVVGKYVKRLLASGAGEAGGLGGLGGLGGAAPPGTGGSATGSAQPSAQQGITWEFLAENGF